MTRFRCTAPGCGAVRSRALPPASCPDKSRCAWEAFEDTVDTAPTQPPAPPPPAQPAPTAAPSATPAPASPSLVVVIDGHRHVVQDTLTLGRNGDLELDRFRADLAVSRQHCRLERQDGRWHLLALSSARTLLDDRLVPAGHAVALAGAHRLVLGETFAVTLELAADPADTTEAGGELDRLLRGGLA